MDNYCGANCNECTFTENCKGCIATCGSPFGGKCVAAEYIKVGGTEAYNEFKSKLKDEINQLLTLQGIPKAEKLYELAGSYVNLEYTLSNGEKIKFLDDKNVYLGAQIELPESEICCGVIADASFIIICLYGCGGSNPELLLYKKR